MRKLWKDLSVSKKLMAVVGLMAFLIAGELFTLMFAMNTLSAVRAFVEGEANWSKGQKDATFSLHQYALTRDPKYYREFQQNLLVPLGDRQARLQLLGPNPDMKLVREGFIQGRIHPEDVPGVIRLLERFHEERHIRHAIRVWADADDLMDDLIATGSKLDHDLRRAGTRSINLNATLNHLDDLNKRMTVLEAEFSATLGEASRWLEKLLMVVLVLSVLTVESTGLWLTFSFSRNLARTLRDMKTGIDEVGRGNFDHTLAVPSADELGKLAEAINRMAADLKTNIGQREQAEKANQIKSAFLANMSHEIRTPLGVIMGLADVLKNSDPSPNERRQYLEVMSETGANLSRIINDILDLSKVEAGHLEIEMSTFSLPDFLQEIVKMMSVQAQRKQNRLILVQDGTQDIRTDRVRLRQILINLVGNALKFTQNGDVTIRSSQTGQTLSFEVSDTGHGIADKNIQELFKPFSQTDESANRRIEGTGLGLVLAKRLSMSLGGDVVLKKTVKGVGSTFEIRIRNDLKNSSLTKLNPGPDILTVVGTLPLASASKPMGSASETTAPIFKGKKFLVVDDSPDNRLLLRALLSRTGAEIQMRNNGQEGADAALAENFDLILMDMQMPVMDGYDATRLLREKGLTIPIVALTARAMKEDRERCLEAGCSEYLRKPIETKLFYSTLESQLAAHQSDPKTESPLELT